jgi:hypothetical protein
MRSSVGPESPAKEDENEGNSDDAGDSDMDLSGESGEPMRDAATFRVFREQVNLKIGAIESDWGKFQRGLRVDVDKISEKLDLIVRAR